MVNPKLKKGDRIILLHMSDESSVPDGTHGTVTSISKVYGDVQYGVDWDNGSKLELLSDTDAWDKEERFKVKKKITEDRDKFIMDNIDLFKYFNIKFLKKYLLMVRASGITNMYGAGPYLYMGSDRIKHEFKYKDVPNEDAFEEMLEHSDQAQAEMINGVINYLNDKGIEEDMSSINKYLQRLSTKIIQTYTLL
jgi:Domain of unknown function (DUF4314)